MVLSSVLVLFILVFSILVVPGVIGLLAILCGIYLCIKCNKKYCIKSLVTGLILILFGLILFLSFRFNINIELENSSNKVIEEFYATI